MQLIGEARAAIVKARSPQDSGTYLGIVRLYSALNQPDALSALGDAVRAMNEAERSGQAADSVGEAEAQIPLLSNDLMLGFYNLPVTLLVMDDVCVRPGPDTETTARRTAVVEG